MSPRYRKNLLRLHQPMEHGSSGPSQTVGVSRARHEDRKRGGVQDEWVWGFLETVGVEDDYPVLALGGASLSDLRRQPLGRIRGMVARPLDRMVVSPPTEDYLEWHVLY